MMHVWGLTPSSMSPIFCQFYLIATATVGWHGAPKERHGKDNLLGGRTYAADLMAVFFVIGCTPPNDMKAISITSSVYLYVYTELAGPLKRCFSTFLYNTVFKQCLK
jgi:hypothetical protein